MKNFLTKIATIIKVIFGYGMINSVFGKSDKENVNNPIVESEEFVTNSSISLKMFCLTTSD